MISFLKRLLFITVGLFTWTACISQYAFFRSNDAYFGQHPPGDKPALFAPCMLKDSGIVFGRVCFSPDGKTFYYSYASGWSDRKTSGTKMLRFIDGKWQKPVIVARELTSPSLSPDGKTMFLSGEDGSVWVMDKMDTGWRKAGLWFESSFSLYNLQAASDGIFYISSNGRHGSKKDYGTFDIYTMNLTGKDTVISPLKGLVNTKGFDGDFFIAPDQSYIIVSAKETPDVDSELWIAFRKKNGTWKAPISLGSEINNGLAHRFGQYVTPDGKYLIYTQGTSDKDFSLYWIRFDSLLAELRHDITE